MLLKLSALLMASLVLGLEHGGLDETLDALFPPAASDVIFIDLTNVDDANGAEIPRNLTEEDTKIIPTHIDFAALKESYAKENKAERFLPSRLFFENKKKRK